MDGRFVAYTESRPIIKALKAMAFWLSAELSRTI